MGGSWAGRHVLVTGAAGFIGSHLVERLVRESAEVRAFVRYNSRNDYGWLETLEPDVLDGFEIFRGDLANPEAVDRALRDCATVFHLGALIPIPYSYVHPREFVTANVVGTLNVLEAARRHRPERLVHTSTSEVYGTPATVPIRETHPLQAQSPYAATKTGADQLVLSYAASFRLPATILRPFNTFGPRQSARAVIPTIIAQALAGEEIRLGTTSTSRDFLYVEDTAAGFLAAGEAAGLEGAVLNLGTGHEVTIAEIAEIVCRLLGREATLSFDPQRTRPEGSEVERLVADASDAQRLMGWRPTVELDEGLQRTIDWFSTALDAYKPQQYNV